MYKVNWTDEAEIVLDKLDKNTIKIILKHVERLKVNPEHFGKHLRGTDQWTLRVGKMRIIFNLNEKSKIVTIITLGHRKKIYKK